ncbi:MAG: hypothetical protein JWN86_336 [Planctomycetota bacterium]|nr:hypothetical protein [Planctomycetota bacterium]
MADDTTLEWFAKDCGLESPLRFVVEGPDDKGEAELREIRGPFAVIGRDSGSDLVLSHPIIERRHAYLQVISGGIFAIDLGSRAGLIFADGKRPSGWLSLGETIRIGPFTIRSLVGSVRAKVEPSEPLSRTFPTERSARLELQFPGPAPPPAFWQVSRALVLLGRSCACRVRLPGDGIALVHAAIVRSQRDSWLVDLLAPGGMTVNGRRVRFARLQEGDEIGVGPQRIGVRSTVPAPSSAPAVLVPISRSSDRPLATHSQPDPLLVSALQELGRKQELIADQFQQALMTMFRLFTGMHQDQMELIRAELAQIHDLTEEHRALLGRQPASPAVPRPIVKSSLRLVGAETFHDPLTGPARSMIDDPQSFGPRQPPVAEAGQEELHLQIARRLAAIQDEGQGRWQKLLGTMLGMGSRASS